MCARATLSPEERQSLLREVRSSDTGERVSVRAGSRDGARGDGGGRGSTVIRPPGSGRGGRPPRRNRLRTTILLVLTLLFLVGGLLSAKVLNVGKNVLSPDRSIFAQLTDLLFRGNRTLAGEKENRINILLIAIGGKGHKGENLADTIMVASMRPKEKDVALLSIPRDLYVQIPDASVYTKINAVHAYRENAQRGEGPLLLKQKVEDITGIPLHYYARVDFTAFKQIVDEIGGVDITIKEGFFDYWHKISFPAGTEHMNGERALAYARARYVEGPQGGDFKRAERQQQLLLAIRNKILSVNTAFDLRAVSGILDALGDNVATNFQLWEFKRLFELARDIPREQIRSAVLTTGPKGLLIGGTEILEGKPASILRPRLGLEKYDEIRDLAAHIFERTAMSPAPSTDAPAPTAAPATPTPSPSPSSTPASVTTEKPTVDVRNGTTVTGYAGRVKAALEGKAFTITDVGNATKRDRTTTIVVDRSGGKKPKSLDALLDALDVKTAVTFPDAEQESDADFVVFLGTDKAERFR